MPDTDNVGKFKGCPWCPIGANRDGLPEVPKPDLEGCGTCK